ncbi:MAG: hypothetical protein CMP93_07725 [Gammaproteobacteria bacterium]|nr:hypothetical protein [Gammaproteobacteria bacterium]
MQKQARKLYTDTIVPGDISEEPAPEIKKLGLEQNCRELAEKGWTVVVKHTSQQIPGNVSVVLHLPDGSD